MADARPIGIFDSGVGGLTVYRTLQQLLPHEDLIYLADTARLPYGTKSRETVARYTLENAKTLLAEGIKLLVVACNTATAHGLPDLKRLLPHLPSFGVIEAGARMAVKASATCKIVVLATEGTVRSNAYANAILNLNPSAQVHDLACGLMVGLVEEGWCAGSEAEAVVSRYLKQLDGIPFDTVVLGCTHFPMLEPVIRKFLPRDVTLIGSAEQVALSVGHYLETQDCGNGNRHKGTNRFLVTDAPERFRRIAAPFLPEQDFTRIELLKTDLVPEDGVTRHWG